MTSLPKFVRHQQNTADPEMLQELIQLRSQLSESNSALKEANSKLDFIMAMIKKALMGDESAVDYLVMTTGLQDSHQLAGNEARIPNTPVPPSVTGRSNGRVHYADEESMPEVANSVSTIRLRERMDFYNDQLNEDELQQVVVQQRKSSLKRQRTNSGSAQGENVVRLRRSNSTSSLDRGSDLRVRDLVARPDSTQQMSHYQYHAEFPLEKDQLPKKPGDYYRQRINKSEATPAPASVHSHEWPQPNGEEMRVLFRPQEGVLSKRPPPPSVTAQRSGDQLRSRPRIQSASPSIQKSSPSPTGDPLHGRPLKYEVVRPSSASRGARPPSGKLRTGGTAAFMSRVTTLPSTGTTDGHQHPSHRPVVPVSSYVTRPSCVDKFSEEEAAMRALESQFEKSAIDLQRRLGIEKAAMVLPQYND